MKHNTQMKKFILIIPLLGWSAFSVNAQVSFPEQLKFGLKAGINASFFNSGVRPFDSQNRRYYSANFKPFVRASGYGGITLDYEFNGSFSIGGELTYSAKGMSYREKNNDVMVVGEEGTEQAYNYFNYQIDYIELPLIVNYRFYTSSAIWLKGYAGLAKSIAVRKKTVLDFAESNVGPDDSQPSKKADLKDVRSLNGTIMAGFKLGENKEKYGFYADLRGAYTINPVFNKKFGEQGNHLDTHMTTFSLGIGFKF